jgi:stage II sporulation protein D
MNNPFIRIVFLLFAITVSLPTFADLQLLEIGIFRSVTLKSTKFVPADNTYQIFDSNDSLIYHLQKNESVTLKVNSNKTISVKVPNEDLGDFKEVRILSNNFESHYNIKGLSPSTKDRDYFGGLSCFSLNGALDVVSLVSMHHYLIGVIESESGNHQGTEYYKVQAIISRTYALKNSGKFRHEGFMMTDLVNCQVYLGKMYRNPKIEQAVTETSNMILVDDDMDFISAAFYSNSGGQTANSEDVWSKEVSYLRSVSDPFSKGRSTYYWTKTFEKDDFLKKLKTFYDYPIDDSLAVNSALNWSQENRAKYFVDWKYHILLTDFRRDFKIRSTYFSVGLEGEKVILKGRGFGHGVGLSQQGAMAMCDMGYSYRDVLHFYYSGVHLIDLNQREFYLAD